MKDNLATRNTEEVFETGMMLNESHAGSTNSAGRSANERHSMLTLLESGQNPGNILRAAREKAGLSLSDMSSMTKINERQLEIIESGDVARMPQDTFAKAFIKSYCKALKMEALPLISAFGYTETTPLPRVASAPLPAQALKMSEHEGHVSAPSSQNKARHAYKKWGVALVLITVLLIIVGLLVRYWGLAESNNMWTNRQTSGNPEGFNRGNAAEVGTSAFNSNIESSASAPDNWDAQNQMPQELQAPSQPVHSISGNASETHPLVGVEPNVAGTPVQNGGMFPDLQQPIIGASKNTANLANSGSSGLRFDFSEPSWVTVKDATGTVLMSQLNAAGSQVVLNGQAPFQMIVGNAKGVRLSHNGVPVNVSAAVKGEVARITVQ